MASESADAAPLDVVGIFGPLGRVLPPGYSNMLSGYRPGCGAPQVSHPKVRKVTFTGSAEHGQIVSKTAADRLIAVFLEVGTKSPMIVFSDCEFDKTAAGAIPPMRVTRQGQSGTAARRIYPLDGKQC